MSAVVVGIVAALAAGARLASAIAAVPARLLVPLLFAIAALAFPFLLHSLLLALYGAIVLAVLSLSRVTVSTAGVYTSILALASAATGPAATGGVPARLGVLFRIVAIGSAILRATTRCFTIGVVFLLTRLVVVVVAAAALGILVADSVSVSISGARVAIAAFGSARALLGRDLFVPPALRVLLDLRLRRLGEMFYGGQTISTGPASATVAALGAALVVVGFLSLRGAVGSVGSLGTGAIHTLGAVTLRSRHLHRTIQRSVRVPLGFLPLSAAVSGGSVVDRLRRGIIAAALMARVVRTRRAATIIAAVSEVSARVFVVPTLPLSLSQTGVPVLPLVGGAVTAIVAIVVVVRLVAASASAGNKITPLVTPAAAAVVATSACGGTAASGVIARIRACIAPHIPTSSLLEEHDLQALLEEELLS
jgi:hypothetical protein